VQEEAVFELASDANASKWVVPATRIKQVTALSGSENNATLLLVSEVSVHLQLQLKWSTTDNITKITSCSVTHTFAPYGEVSIGARAAVYQCGTGSGSGLLVPYQHQVG
jgi:hypothetical protein